VLDLAGADSGHGNKLAAALRGVGLANVDAQALAYLRRPSELAFLVVPVVERLREAMVDAGLATGDEIDQVVRLFEDSTSELSVYSPVMVSARGRPKA
jgi:hypothetical protein